MQSLFLTISKNSHGNDRSTLLAAEWVFFSSQLMYHSICHAQNSSFTTSFTTTEQWHFELWTKQSSSSQKLPWIQNSVFLKERKNKEEERSNHHLSLYERRVNMKFLRFSLCVCRFADSMELFNKFDYCDNWWKLNRIKY